MILTAFNILFFAFISALLGSGKVPRFVSLGAVFIVLGLQFYAEPVLLAAWLWVWGCVRLLPTNSLLSAVHGYKPARDDSRLWDWLQDLAIYAEKLTRTKKEKVGAFKVETYTDPNYYIFGIIYGFLRASLAIPAIIIIGNWWPLLFLLSGFIYYAAGWYGRRYNGKDNVRWVEGFIGFLYAICLSYS